MALGGSCITIKLENPGPGINVPLKPQGQKIECSCAEGEAAERWFHPDQLSQGTRAVVPWRRETGCRSGREPVLPQNCAVVGLGAGSSLLDCALLGLWSSLAEVGVSGSFCEA